MPIPLWDPVRPAEEMCVLDLISKGRVSYAFGVGHRPEEYRHFGIDLAERGRLADEIVAVIGPMVRGETVDITRADSVAALRAPDSPYRIFTPDEAATYVRAGRPLPLHPLCGGVAPAVAWPYLECAATATTQ